MFPDKNHFIVKEILHKIEVLEPVSSESLMYLYQEARKHPEVSMWLEKLLNNEYSTINLELINQDPTDTYSDSAA